MSQVAPSGAVTVTTAFSAVTTGEVMSTVKPSCSQSSVGSGSGDGLGAAEKLGSGDGDAAGVADGSGDCDATAIELDSGDALSSPDVWSAPGRSERATSARTSAAAAPAKARQRAPAPANPT